jgi:hypothetical protein
LYPYPIFGSQTVQFGRLNLLKVEYQNLKQSFTSKHPVKAMVICDFHHHVFCCLNRVRTVGFKQENHARRFSPLVHSTAFCDVLPILYFLAKLIVHLVAQIRNYTGYRLPLL